MRVVFDDVCEDPISVVARGVLTRARVMLCLGVDRQVLTDLMSQARVGRKGVRRFFVPQFQEDMGP